MKRQHPNVLGNCGSFIKPLFFVMNLIIKDLALKTAIIPILRFTINDIVATIFLGDIADKIVSGLKYYVEIIMVSPVKKMIKIANRFEKSILSYQKPFVNWG